MIKKNASRRSPGHDAGTSVLAYGIQQWTAFQKTYGHLDNMELSRLATEHEQLGFKLRHLLWNRHAELNQPN